jgi:ABC-2 type transport system permease protein
MLAFALSAFSYGIYQFARFDPERGGRLLDNLIAISFAGVFAFLLFWGFSQAVFTIFFSTDLALLLSLPIERRDVFIYKTMEATILNARLSLLFLTPLLIMLGVYHAAPPFYYLVAAVIVPLIAALPGGLGIIIASAIARRIPRTRLKGIITFVGSFIGVGIWVVINQFSGQFSSDTADFGSPTMTTMELAASPAFKYVPSGWAYVATTRAATGNYLESLLFLAFMVLATVLISYFALKSTIRFYADGILDEVGGSMVPLSSSSEVGRGTGVLAPLSVGSSPLLANLRRDLLLFSRESGIITQCLVLTVFFLLAPFVVKAESLEKIGEVPVTFIGAALAAFLGGNIGSGLIPLERLGFWRNLVIPAGRQLTVAAKFVVGISIITALISIASAVHVVAGKTAGFESTLFSIFFSWIGFAIGIAISSHWGNFAWDNPRRILKGGGGFIYAFTIILTTGVMYLLAVFSFRYISNFVNPLFIFLVLSLGFLTISYIVTALRVLNMEWLPDV